jgi:hypothetical protein
MTLEFVWSVIDTREKEGEPAWCNIIIDSERENKGTLTFMLHLQEWRNFK